MKILALAAVMFTVPALVGDRVYLEAADPVWLQSNDCTQPDPTQCALELALKKRLREGPIYVGPAN